MKHQISTETQDSVMLWGLLGGEERYGLSDGTAMSLGFLCPNGTTTLSLTISLPLLHPSCGWLTAKIGQEPGPHWFDESSIGQSVDLATPKIHPRGTAGTEKGVI